MSRLSTETPQADPSPAEPAPRESDLIARAERLQNLPSAGVWEQRLRGRQASTRSSFRPREARYYYRRVIRRLQHMVSPGADVLDIGCGRGDLLDGLQPAYGLGIDFDPKNLAEARRRHPKLDFAVLDGTEVGKLNRKFDYIIVNQALSDYDDVLALFRALQSVCHARTRLIIVHYSRLWQPALRLAEWLRIKPPQADRTWLPTNELSHLLGLADFETLRQFGLTPLPLPVPGLASLANRFLGNLPGLHHLGINSVIVARSIDHRVLDRGRKRSVSIIVPARNEAGNIRSLLGRLPHLAEQQEIIFVEGHSGDDTWKEINRAAADYAGPWRVRAFQQSGKGKGDAVRKGFAHAEGEVLMILDADLSVPPEELRPFYDALIEGHGELINGSRMVYLMDQRAMRFLNLLGNKVFGWLFTTLLHQRFRDTLCGTKVLLREDYIRRLGPARSYFGRFDPFGDFDLLFGAAKANLKITDLPVHYKARTYGTTNISRFRHGLLLLRMCWFAARKITFI